MMTCDRCGDTEDVNILKALTVEYGWRFVGKTGEIVCPECWIIDNVDYKTVLLLTTVKNALMSLGKNALGKGNCADYDWFIRDKLVRNINSQVRRIKAKGK